MKKREVNRIFKSALIMLTFLMMNRSVSAQAYIEGFGGWLWTASVPGYRQDMKVDDLGNYGARIGVEIQESRGLEFEWNHTQTTVRYYDWDADAPDKTGTTLNYYMLGFVQNISTEAVQPYGLFNIGVLNVNPDRTGYSNFNYFTVGLGAGFKYYFSDHVGIRVQARLLMPMQFSGAGFGCGIGTGGANCGAGVYSYSSLFQGDFTGGLVIKFGG